MIITQIYYEKKQNILLWEKTWTRYFFCSSLNFYTCQNLFISCCFIDTGFGGTLFLEVGLGGLWHVQKIPYTTLIKICSHLLKIIVWGSVRHLTIPSKPFLQWSHNSSVEILSWAPITISILDFSPQTQFSNLDWSDRHFQVNLKFA